MKKLLLALGIVALMCSPAMAGRNANGAMLMHVNPNLTYSQLQPYCDDVAYPLPTNCLGLVTSDPRDPNVESMIWMVGAFNSSASPGVLAWQVGLNGNVDASWFTDHLACGPTGWFEIPDAGWPASGTGTAVAYPTPIHSILFKMYWFACGSPGPGSTLGTTNYYNGDHHAEWADDSTPPVTDYVTLFGEIQWGGPGFNQCPPEGPVNGACCFADGTCQILASADCATAGGRYMGDGSVCTPNPCPQPEACCFADGHCTDLLPDLCTQQGGTPEAGQTCATFSCPQPPKACCFADGHCTDMLEMDCVNAGGVYHGEATCETPGFQCPQPPTGQCCFPDGSCQVLTQDACTAAGGTQWTEGGNCSPNTCPPVAVKSTTWGQIKGSYR